MRSSYPKHCHNPSEFVKVSGVSISNRNKGINGDEKDSKNKKEDMHSTNKL
jgi:hypothetical protein